MKITQKEGIINQYPHDRDHDCEAAFLREKSEKIAASSFGTAYRESGIELMDELRKQVPHVWRELESSRDTVSPACDTMQTVLLQMISDFRQYQSDMDTLKRTHDAANMPIPRAIHTNLSLEQYILRAYMYKESALYSAASKLIYSKKSTKGAPQITEITEREVFPCYVYNKDGTLTSIITLPPEKEYKKTYPMRLESLSHLIDVGASYHPDPRHTDGAKNEITENDVIDSIEADATKKRMRDLLSQREKPLFDLLSKGCYTIKECVDILYTPKDDVEFNRCYARLRQVKASIKIKLNASGEYDHNCNVQAYKSR